jgi:hypothetical protein
MLVKEIRELLRSYKRGDISYNYLSRSLREAGIKEAMIEIETNGNFNINKVATYLKKFITTK